MLFAKIEASEVVRYPYTVQALREDNPGVSFALPLDPGSLATYGAVEVSEVSPPPAPEGHEVVEGTPELNAGVWQQTWQLQALPPLPTPTIVTMRQAQRALYDAGLLDSVEAAIASFPGTLGDKARIDWRTAQEVKRNDPIVQALIPSLGLTEPQLDDLFVAAAAIV